MSMRRQAERARRHALGVLLVLASLAYNVGAGRAQPAQRPSPTEFEPAVAAASLDAARAQADAADPYDQLIDSGVAEFAGGHWAEARLLFERAHLLRPSARTLRALGMSDFNLHRYALALHELEAALASAEHPLDAAMRAQVELLARRARPLVGRFAVTQAPASGSLHADGGIPVRDLEGRLLLDIGQHTLSLRATGFGPLQRTLEVHGGEDGALELQALPLGESTRAEARPVRAQGRRHALVVSLAAAGLAGAAGGLFGWLRADRHFDALASDCRARGGCFEDAVDLGRVRRLERTAYGLAGVGASLLLTSAVLGAIELLRDDAAPQAAP